MPSGPERDEGDQQGEGDRDDRDQRRRDVPQEQEDDEDDGEDESRRAVSRVAPIDRRISSDRSYTGTIFTPAGAPLDLLDLLLDAPDDVEGVLPVAHDHDPGDDVPGPVEVPPTRAGSRAPSSRPPIRGPGSASRPRSDERNDVPDVLQGPYVSRAPGPIYSAPAISISRPPTSAFPGTDRFPPRGRSGSPYASGGWGPPCTWYCRTVPAAWAPPPRRRGPTSGSSARYQSWYEPQVARHCAARVCRREAYWKTHPAPWRRGPSSVRAPAGSRGRTEERYSRVAGPRPSRCRCRPRRRRRRRSSRSRKIPGPPGPSGPTMAETNRVGNLVLDDVGLLVPPGKNDDLGVAKIRDRVGGGRGASTRGPRAPRKTAMTRTRNRFLAEKLDDPVDHFPWPAVRVLTVLPVALLPRSHAALPGLARNAAGSASNRFLHMSAQKVSTSSPYARFTRLAALAVIVSTTIPQTGSIGRSLGFRGASCFGALPTAGAACFSWPLVGRGQTVRHLLLRRRAGPLQVFRGLLAEFADAVVAAEVVRLPPVFDRLPGGLRLPLVHVHRADRVDVPRPVDPRSGRAASGSRSRRGSSRRRRCSSPA